MAGCRRQVRHQDEEVEQAPENYGGSLFEEAGQHEPVASRPRSVASKRGFARSCLRRLSESAERTQVVANILSQEFGFFPLQRNGLLGAP